MHTWAYAACRAAAASSAVFGSELIDGVVAAEATEGFDLWVLALGLGLDGRSRSR